MSVASPHLDTPIVPHIHPYIDVLAEPLCMFVPHVEAEDGIGWSGGGGDQFVICAWGGVRFLEDDGTEIRDLDAHDT